MPIDFASSELTELTPKIAVIGVGGAGCNAVNNMIAAELQGVDFMVANTDAQSLAASKASNRMQLGVKITQGLGAGAQPKVGEAAAEEALEHIEGMLDGAHMAFITAGMGGGTGTGAAPVIARLAREKGILTVGVVTKPFQFEGARRMKIAEAGIDALQQHVDTLIVIPNQNLFRVANERTTFADAFAMADEVLHSGVRGITDLMVMPGLINLDFADVRTVMSEMGKAMMGTGEAEGESRARIAAEAAISNPLLDEVSLKGARGVIINVTGGMDMTLYEVDEATNLIREQVDSEANIIFGSAFNDGLGGQLRVSVVATGIDALDIQNPIPQPVRTERPSILPADIEETSADAPKAEVAAMSGTEDLPSAQTVESTETTPHVETSEFEVEGEAEYEVEDAVSADEVVEIEAEPVFEPAAIETPEPVISSPAAEEMSAPVQGVADEEALPEQDTFVARAPMAPKANTAPLEVADPFAESDYENAATEEKEPASLLNMGSRTSPASRRSKIMATGQTLEEMSVDDQTVAGSEAGTATTESAEEPQPNARRSLFQMMTSGRRGEEEPDTKPAAKPEMGSVSAEDRVTPREPQEQLEIPSFLRRQQN